MFVYATTFVTSANRLNSQLCTKVLQRNVHFNRAIRQSSASRDQLPWLPAIHLGNQATRIHVYMYRYIQNTKLHRSLDIKSGLTFIWIYQCPSPHSVYTQGRALCSDSLSSVMSWIKTLSKHSPLVTLFTHYQILSSVEAMKNFSPKPVM